MLLGKGSLKIKRKREGRGGGGGSSLSVRLLCEKMPDFSNRKQFFDKENRVLGQVA